MLNHVEQWASWQGQRGSGKSQAQLHGHVCLTTYQTPVKLWLPVLVPFLQLLEYSYWLYAPSASMSTSHDVMVKLVKQTHPSSLLGLEWKVSDCCLCTPFCTVTLTSQCENEGNTLGDWPRCGLNKGGSSWKHVDFCCICHDRKINTNCTAMGIQWPSLPMYPVSP